MNNFKRSLPDNTNRHALILTHSLSRFTLPRCALYNDNPGLWDIQLSSRGFCEIIAKVMSLIRRLFLVSVHHTNYAKIASAADFRPPRSSDQRRSGRLLVRPTPHMRELHTLSGLSLSRDHWYDSGVSRVTNFLPILQLSCFHVSRTTGKSKFHCISLSRL